MPITGKLYEWNDRNVHLVTEEGAAYALFDGSKGCIYIGSSKNLRQRFSRYWARNFAEDTCKRDTKFYKREHGEDYKKRETELLEEYKTTHGKLPRCNDVIP